MKDLRASFTLAPFQEEFVQAFMAGSATRVWNLVAQPGTGKTFTSVQLVKEMLKGASDGALRVLVVAPQMALCHQWLHVFSDRLEGKAFVRPLDRAEWIANFARPDVATTLDPCIMVVSRTFIRREEVFSSIVRGKWDLVIADDADHLGGNTRLGQHIIDCEAFRTVLLLSSSELEFSGIDRVHVFQLSKPSPSLQPEDLIYSLSRTEIQIFDLLNFMRENAHGPSQSLEVHNYIKLAESSFYALYESVSGKLEATVCPEEPTIDCSETTELDLSKVSWPSLCGKLLTLLDEVDVESKSKAIVGLISVEKMTSRIAIHTQYSRTAAYLATILEDEGLAVVVLSGSMRSAEIAATLRNSGDRFILIATDAILTGIQLPTADIYVEYDRADSEAISYMRRTRYSPKEGDGFRWIRMVRDGTCQ